MIKIVEYIGDKTLHALSALNDIFYFTFLCSVSMFLPSSYNPAMRSVLIKQIYFTAIEILPLFAILSILFGTVVIGVVISVSVEYGLQEQMGSIIIKFVVDEFAPFFTALLISLRSSAAVNAEIAVMKVNKELNTLKEYKVDLVSYLFIPRIISGILSVTALTTLFAIIMLLAGYVFVFFYMSFDLHSYKMLLLNAIELKDLLILFAKGIAFGFMTMLIPIYSGLQAFNSYTAIPISVLKGMVRLFISIFVIEVLSLLVQFL
ncbi:MlaE family ABC transporter permease [Sulfurimonas marina]|uniref:ABC transporter permease n=1 Tax=Sulfurimonas marina TaxID=2590551 RepID=A0A7M3V940_9BACT|nr:ABC transporter permease [Sulfurimonas marina]QOP40273.1 ABC transporter permease [Sulfurimonas marina]